MTSVEEYLRARDKEKETKGKSVEEQLRALSTLPSVEEQMRALYKEKETKDKSVEEQMRALY